MHGVHARLLTSLLLNLASARIIIASQVPCAFLILKSLHVAILHQNQLQLQQPCMKLTTSTHLIGAQTLLARPQIESNYYALTIDYFTYHW